jgi:integrase/recombinase XerD
LEDLASATDPFLYTLSKGSEESPLDRRHIRARFRRSSKVLDEDRFESLTAHDGRHSFVSHALAGGRTLAEVRDAAGHASIATTSVYTHVAVDDDGEIGELFS